MAEPVLQEDVLVNFVVGDERLEAVAKSLAKHVNILQSETEKLTLTDYFTKLGVEMTNVGTIFKDFKTTAIFTKAVGDVESILKAVKGIGASAGMTQKQFAEMNAGIAQAAAETGLEFSAMAAHAKDLYGSTGLKEGLGQTVLDAERLGQVFDTSGTSFSKLTASMVQFGDGTVKADDVMKSFDKTTGITGKRMEDMLESLTDIAKTMRNVVGGGKLFGESMKKITEFSTQVSAKFTEMGGSGDTLNQLMKDVMDPNKWGDIADKMPGMAGNLFDMQQAMASGDMEKFGKLMQAGAQATDAMGAGMPTIARAASGMDFTSAELLARIDFKKIGKDAAAGTDVMTRSAGMLRSMGDEWDKFLNNMSKSLMPLLMPVISLLSSILSWMNRLMQAGDGWVGIIVTWGIVLTGVIWSVVMLLRKATRDVAKGIVEGVGEAAKGAGKAAGEGVGAMLDAIGKAASKAAAYAVPMMQVGLAMLFLASAVYVLAQALSVLSTLQNLGTVAIGLGMIIGVMAAFAIASIFLAPIAPMMALVGGAFLLFAGAVYVLAAGMALAAPALDLMVNSLARLAALPLVTLAIGLYLLTPALAALLAIGMLWGTAGLIAVAGLYLLGGALLLFGSFADSITNFAKSVAVIGQSTASLEKLNSLDFSGIQRLGAALQTFGEIKINVEVSDASAKSVTGLIAIVKDISASIVEIVSAGMMAVMYAPQMSFIFDYLFNKDTGILVSAVRQIGEALGTGSLFSFDKSISKGVMESMTFIVKLMGDFATAFVELATMGQMLTGNAGVSGAITYAITFAITELTSIVALVNDKLVSFWGNTTIPKNVQESMNFVLTLMSQFSDMFINLAVMGKMLAQDSKLGEAINWAIVFAVTTIKGVIETIDDEMVGLFGNTTIPENVMKSITGVLDILKSFNAMFIDLAVMGMMLATGAGAAGGVGASIDVAIASIFGDKGFIKRMVDGIRGQKIDTKAITDVSGSIKSLSDMVNPLVELTAMGALFKSGEDENLFYFPKTIGTFMQKMEEALGSSKFSMPEMMGKLDGLKVLISEEAKISAQTGADIALADHTTATAEHQQTVERLLENIRDGISQMGGQTAREVVATRGNTPSWKPEDLFSDVSETF
jgi:hypothetical protein